MGAPSPCPVMPPRVNVVCSVSRYWLEDMVVVQVCCRLSRTILVLRAAALSAAGAARATLPATGTTDAACRNLRRVILNSSPAPTVLGHTGHLGHRVGPFASGEARR